MRSEYALTTLPWVAVLSALALFFAWRAYRRHEYATCAVRVGWATLVWAVWLVGLMQLVVRVGGAVADWASGFVFRPTVWLGVVVGVIGLLFIMTGSALRRRGGAGRSDDAREPERPIEADRTAKPVEKSKPSGDGSAGGDDMADIEAILKKHGIE